jgi:hypothetical protein
MPAAFHPQMGFHDHQHGYQRNTGKQRPTEYDHCRLQMQKFPEQSSHTEQYDRKVNGYQFTVPVLDGSSP